MAEYYQAIAGVGVTITYSETNTQTGYKVSISKIHSTLSNCVIGLYWDNSTSWAWSGQFTSSLDAYPNISKSVTKTHSSQSTTLKIVVYNGSTGVTAEGSKTFSISAKTSYTVTLAPNGGSGSNKTLTKWHDESLAISSSYNYSRSGYSFVRWNNATNNTGGTSVSSGGNYTGNSAITLYAIWQRAVTYNGNGSTGGSTAGSGNVVATTNITIANNGFTRTGYTFKRWNTNTSDTGTGYNPGAAYSGGSVTLYAIWNRTVTYNANGHGTAPAASTGIATSALSLSSISAAGWKFIEWNTAEDGTGDSYTTSYPASNPSITLYAQWERNIDSFEIGDIRALRVNSSSSTIETDEGTYLYATIPFTVKGAASADISMAASMTDNDGIYVDTFIVATGQSFANHVLTETLASGKPETEADFTGSFTIRASGIDTDKSYTLSVDLTASNTSTTQADVTTSKGALIATAYFTMDLLGDAYYYNLSTDTSVDASKTYYEYVQNPDPDGPPYIYSVVESPTGNPQTSGYYEANGPKPGHGVSFGAPAKTEGFHVAMDADFTEDATFLGDMNVGTGANVTQMLPYIVISNLAWTSANLSACQAAVADYRPCVARFSNGAVVEFDGDAQTDAYN